MQIVRIGAMTAIAEGIVAFELVPEGDTALLPFTAGAHIDVYTPSGHVRQYSLVNDESERHRYIVAVQWDAAGRGGSASMHNLGVGAVLHVGQPRNTFELVRDDVPTVLLAGGIGITPLIAMAHVLLRRGRPFELHYAVRADNRVAFRDFLDRGGDGMACAIYRDDDPPEWRFDAGSLAARIKDGARVYMCGPSGFMDAVSRACASRPDIDLRLERFAAPEPAGPGPEFTVSLARRGLSVPVPAGATILETLRGEGIEPDVSCEQGVCGTCLTTVLEGQIDHRDYFLSAHDHKAGDRMLICVSRGKPGTTLVLDL